ncbi:XRE family transcriptional regulator [bacterium 1XD21-13]|nr:XRE family transcriptional regulator [bacterium 1XD21-13]
MDALIGKRICQARKAKFLTQEDLSELSGLSVSAFSRIETGRNSTSLKTLAHLCGVLDVTLNYLLYDILAEQPIVQNPVVMDVLSMLEPMDEKQQQFILDFIKLYISSVTR